MEAYWLHNFALSNYEEYFFKYQCNWPFQENFNAGLKHNISSAN